MRVNVACVLHQNHPSAKTASSSFPAAGLPYISAAAPVGFREHIPLGQSLSGMAQITRGAVLAKVCDGVCGACPLVRVEHKVGSSNASVVVFPRARSPEAWVGCLSSGRVYI